MIPFVLLKIAVLNNPTTTYTVLNATSGIFDESAPNDFVLNFINCVVGIIYARISESEYQT